MPSERYFIDGALHVGELALEGQEFHHMAHVMRTAAGDRVELVNGRGALASAVVSSIDKKRALLQIDSIAETKPDPVQIILAQAIPRPNRLDFILEKGTELGMTALWIFPGEKGERHKIGDNQLERMRAVTIAAMKQCGRLFLPEIVLMPLLKQWKKPQYPLFFGDLDPKAPYLSSIWNYPQEGVIFVTGPESGFSEAETEALRTLNAQGVRLHHNTLRTDTASIAALSLMTHLTLQR